jgi:hypothetical protein
MVGRIAMRVRVPSAKVSGVIVMGRMRGRVGGIGVPGGIRGGTRIWTCEQFERVRLRLIDWEYGGMKWEKERNRNIG